MMPLLLSLVEWHPCKMPAHSYPELEGEDTHTSGALTSLMRSKFSMLNLHNVDNSLLIEGFS